jgi:MFS family permease
VSDPSLSRHSVNCTAVAQSMQFRLAYISVRVLYHLKRKYVCLFRSCQVFNIPCALAPNIGALLSCRFIAGVFASSPLTLAGGSISDIWNTEERGFAIALFAAAPYSGPVLGPIGMLLLCCPSSTLADITISSWRMDWFGSRLAMDSMGQHDLYVPESLQTFVSR